MDLHSDHRIVMTLDAGGTNFVFNAIRGGEEIFEPIRIKAKGATLEEVLTKIITGFNMMKEGLVSAAGSSATGSFLLVRARPKR